MKILFYINTLGRGGAERVISNLANSFSGVQYESVLVTSAKVENEYNVDDKVRRIILNDDQKKRNFISKNISLIRKLRKTIKAENPDVVVSFMAEPNFRTIISTMGLKTKTLISVRNDPNKEYPNKPYRFLAKRLYKKADAVVFQTEEAKAWFPEAIQAKSKIIANDVNPIFFETEYVGGKDIVTLGRLTEQKNHSLLIEAFSRIKDQFPDVNLMIYGSGNLEERLDRQIAELELTNRVFLMGQTTDSQKVLSEAKCFVLSSDFEGMPNALLEALVVGVPSISTDCPCGGPKCMIKDGVNGLLTRVGNVEDLCTALNKILSNDDFALTLSQNAKKSSEKYRSDKVFAEWKSFLESIL